MAGRGNRKCQSLGVKQHGGTGLGKTSVTGAEGEGSMMRNKNGEMGRGGTQRPRRQHSRTFALA